MANNFFLGQDPLLFQQTQYQGPRSDYNPDMLNQMNDTLSQYKLYKDTRNMTPNNDYIGEFDELLSNLSNDTLVKLNENPEYTTLNQELTKTIQREILNSVRWKINSNPSVVENINKQKEIIKNITNQLEDEQRRNMNEINDYVKNYSNITFDEYKKIKNGENKKNTKIPTD